MSRNIILTILIDNELTLDVGWGLFQNTTKTLQNVGLQALSFSHNSGKFLHASRSESSQR